MFYIRRKQKRRGGVYHMKQLILPEKLLSRFLGFPLFPLVYAVLETEYNTDEKPGYQKRLNIIHDMIGLA
jgi:hypothetical protein